MPPSSKHAIPKNNLQERMLKLGYKVEAMKIVPPVLDNSKVVKEEVKPVFESKPYQGSEYTQPTSSNIKTEPTLKLENFNIDDWSDFDEDE